MKCTLHPLVQHLKQQKDASPSCSSRWKSGPNIGSEVAVAAETAAAKGNVASRTSCWLRRSQCQAPDSQCPAPMQDGEGRCEHMKKTSEGQVASTTPCLLWRSQCQAPPEVPAASCQSKGIELLHTVNSGNPASTVACLLQRSQCHAPDIQEPAVYAFTQRRKNKGG